MLFQWLLIGALFRVKRKPRIRLFRESLEFFYFVSMVVNWYVVSCEKKA